VNRWAKHKKLTYNVGKINKEKKFRLFKLLIRRPTLSEVRKKGIIKGSFNNKENKISIHIHKLALFFFDSSLN
jgi:hypothetical protein